MGLGFGHLLGLCLGYIKCLWLRLSDGVRFEPRPFDRFVLEFCAEQCAKYPTQKEFGLRLFDGLVLGARPKLVLGLYDAFWHGIN